MPENNPTERALARLTVIEELVAAGTPGPWIFEKVERWPFGVRVIRALLEERGAYAAAEPFEDSSAEEWQTWHAKRKLADAALLQFAESGGGK